MPTQPIFELGANDLDLFKRYPSHLRRYLTWSSEIKAAYRSIPGFVCQERLKWAPAATQDKNRQKSPEELQSLQPLNPIPFADSADYKILRNDWPYATPPDIAHLVVWLKTPFVVSKPEGHLQPEERQQIQAFVDAQFAEPLRKIYGEENGTDRVLWFKNWSALQSVGSLEHFHCFVRGAGEEFLSKWTGEGKRDLM